MRGLQQWMGRKGMGWTARDEEPQRDTEKKVGPLSNHNGRWGPLCICCGSRGPSIHAAWLIWRMLCLLLLVVPQPQGINKNQIKKIEYKNLVNIYFFMRINWIVNFLLFNFIWCWLVNSYNSIGQNEWVDHRVWNVFNLSIFNSHLWTFTMNWNIWQKENKNIFAFWVTLFVH